MPTDVVGRDGQELASRLSASDDCDERFDMFEGLLLRRLACGPVPDPAVAWAFDRLSATRGAARVEALAAELGCSRRHLRDGFARQVGPRPKMWVG